MNNNELKSLFIDVCNGFSFCNDVNLYFKHPDILAESECEKAREIAEDRARKNGLDTSDIILQQALESGAWTKQKENSLAIFERDYRRLNQARFSPISTQQLKSLREEILNIENEWVKIAQEKAGLLENSIERAGEKGFNEHMIFVSLFKDKKLEIPAFDEELFEYLDDGNFYKISVALFKEVNRFKTENLTKIAIESFFQRRFSLSSNIMDFFGKHLYLLTDYQISLLKLGEKFKGILDEISGQIESGDTPDDIEDIFYLNRAGVLKSEVDIAKERAMWS